MKHSLKWFAILNNFRWYDISMKTNKKISKCNSRKIFDCTMQFIVSKMNCSMEWDVMYYPAQYPTCTSKLELKKYIKLRKSVFYGKFENEIGHCFAKKCQHNYTIAHLRMDYDKELLYKYFMNPAQENTTLLIFTKKNEMVGSIYIF